MGDAPKRRTTEPPRGWRNRRTRIALLLLVVTAFITSGLGCMIGMPGSSYRGELAPLTERERLSEARLRADVEALCGVIEEGALRHTASLSLVGNQLSDAGMRVLAASLGRDGVAPELQTLELSCNAAGDAACTEVLASLRSAQLRERDGDGAAALT